MEAKLEQSTAAMAAMHQALIESQEAQGKLVAAERDKADAERRNVARLAREAEELKATIAGLRAADPEPRTTKLEADLIAAERRATAAEQALDLERKARELAESRAAQYAAEAEDLASELEAERAGAAGQVHEWESMRVEGAVTAARALSEASRWEKQARERAEHCGVLQREIERSAQDHAAEMDSVRAGYRDVVEKQRRARARAEERLEASEAALQEALEREAARAAEAQPAVEPVVPAAGGQEATLALTPGATALSVLGAVPPQPSPSPRRPGQWDSRASEAGGLDETAAGRNTMRPPPSLVLVSDEEVRPRLSPRLAKLALELSSLTSG